MRKLKQELIEKLRKGECIIDNTGNLDTELLTLVIKEAFKIRDTLNGTSLYYGRLYNSKNWNCCDRLNSQLFIGWNNIIPLKEFEEKKVTKFMEKKIIGYKAPYDLFGGIVKKGDLFFYNGTGYYHTFINDNRLRTVKRGSHPLPKEIVETWEPYYEEIPTLPKIGGYEGKYENGVITYGCQSFSKEVVKQVNNINSMETIRIKGVDITKSEIEQICKFIDNQ